MGLASKHLGGFFGLFFALAVVMLTNGVHADFQASVEIEYSSTYYSYPSGVMYNVYAGYCGNNYCEYGENAFSCPFDCYNPFKSHYYSSCSLNSFPRTVSAGSWSDIAVRYTDLFYEPWAIPVSCGNGAVAYAYGAVGRTGTAFARCYFPTPRLSAHLILLKY